MSKYYKIYNLKYEYQYFVGGNPIAVVSDLTEEQLLFTYPELQKKMPFVHFTKNQWEKVLFEISKFNKNEDKHRKRAERHGDVFGYRDGETELFMRCLDKNTVINEVTDILEKEKLSKAFDCLNEKQARRIYLYYFKGFTYRQIADIEQVAEISIRESINGGINKLKKLL